MRQPHRRSAEVWRTWRRLFLDERTIYRLTPVLSELLFCTESNEAYWPKFAGDMWVRQSSRDRNDLTWELTADHTSSVSSLHISSFLADYKIIGVAKARFTPPWHRGDADDIVVIAQSPRALQTLLDNVDTGSREYGLEISRKRLRLWQLRQQKNIVLTAC